MAEGTDFLATPIPAEHKTGALSSYNTLGDVFKGVGELRTKMSQRPAMHELDAPTEPTQRAAVLKKLGFTAPESPDRYDLPDNPVTKTYREWAHKRGLPQDMAKGLLEDILAHASKIASDNKAASENKAKELDAALRKEFGNDYDTNMQSITKAKEWLGAGDSVAGLKQLLAIGKNLNGGQFMSSGGGGAGGNDLAAVRAKRLAMDNDPAFQKVRKNPLAPEHKEKMKEYQALFDSEAQLALQAKSASQ